MSRALTMLALLASLSTPLAAAIDATAHGARGDGKTDDTAALQRAIAAAMTAQETLLIPAGTYRIDTKEGLRIPSGSRIELAPEAVLQAIPSGLEHSRVLLIEKASNIQITGGVIEGDREHHTGTTGEWGNGIELRASQRVSIRQVAIRSCWGDGIYIGDKCQAVEIMKVTCSHNRRQGLSITSGADFSVRDSIFQNTQGTAPACGIDIEPNRGETVANCQIVNCTILDNAGGGIQVGPADKDRGQAFVRGFVADGCTVERNGTSPPPRYAIQIANCENAIVRKCRLTGNWGIGIGVKTSTGTQLLENSVVGTRLTTNRSDAGLLFVEDQQTVAKGNIVQSNEGYGAFRWRSSTNVTGNRITGNRKGEVR